MTDLSKTTTSITETASDFEKKITIDLIKDIRTAGRQIRWAIVITGLVTTAVQSLLLWYVVTAL